jgi:hypothetical protein
MALAVAHLVKSVPATVALPLIAHPLQELAVRAAYFSLPLAQIACAIIVALLGVAQGAQVKRSVAKQSVSTRSIAGVPVHDYRADA